MILFFLARAWALPDRGHRFHALRILEDNAVGNLVTHIDVAMLYILGLLTLNTLLSAVDTCLAYFLCLRRRVVTLLLTHIDSPVKDAIHYF